MDSIRDFKGQELTLTCLPEIEAAASGAAPRRFTGVAYGGGVITDHFMFDKVIFDLSTVSAPDKMPVLLDHDSEMIVGFTVSVKVGGRIDVEGTILDDGPGRKVAALADQGFPWQMSVRIMPGTVVVLDEGMRMKVNGKDVAGPAAVFKDSLIREVSFCALGADRETEANVFNLKEVRMDSTTSVPDRDMAIAALNDEKNRFKDENGALASRNREFAAENAELKGQVKALEFERRTLSESLDAARKEAESARGAFEAQRRSARQALLAEAFTRLGLSPSENVTRAVVDADEAVFTAFMKTLEGVKPAAAPPAGAFASMAPAAGQDGPPDRTLAEMAAARAVREKGKEGRKIGN
jgi:hypothetical protein